MSDREERIRQRAHALWEQEGRPHGRDREHWERARYEVESATSATQSQSTPATVDGGASALQPGGVTPGGGPGALGSIGTGGASTAGAPSGTVKRKRRTTAAPQQS
jgi:hypothetical protein